MAKRFPTCRWLLPLLWQIQSTSQINSKSTDIRQTTFHVYQMFVFSFFVSQRDPTFRRKCNWKFLSMDGNGFITFEIKVASMYCICSWATVDKWVYSLTAYSLQSLNRKNLFFDICCVLLLSWGLHNIYTIRTDIQSIAISWSVQQYWIWVLKMLKHLY